jgi:ABC-type transporter Mla subunit MlaD
MMRTISIDEARQKVKDGVLPSGSLKIPQKPEEEEREIEVIQQAIADLKQSLERTSMTNTQQMSTAVAQVTHAVMAFSDAIAQLGGDQSAALKLLAQAMQQEEREEEIKEWTFRVTERDDRDNIVAFKATRG